MELLSGKCLPCEATREGIPTPGEGASAKPLIDHELPNGDRVGRVFKRKGTTESVQGSLWEEGVPLPKGSLGAHGGG